MPAPLRASSQWPQTFHQNLIPSKDEFTESTMALGFRFPKPDGPDWPPASSRNSTLADTPFDDCFCNQRGFFETGRLDSVL